MVDFVLSEFMIGKFIHFVRAQGVNILLALVPITLVALYFVLFRYNAATGKQVQQLKFVSQLSSGSVSDYPVVKYPYDPYISAQSAVILDDASHVVLYSKNPTLRFPMASTTKIMTALVAMEHYKDDDILTIYSDGIEGVEVGFVYGERVKFIDVLYGMMLPSGNDAAYAIAENYPGGLPAFVAAMNKKAQELHLYNTRYSDPAGLDDDGNFTSSLELVRLASYALRNQKFAEIVSTKSRLITTVNGEKQYYLYNLNRLLGYDGVIGVKTGYTEGAGGVLVTAKRENGRTFVVAVIKSEDRFADTLVLLNYLKGNVTYNSFSFR